MARKKNVSSPEFLGELRLRQGTKAENARSGGEARRKKVVFHLAGFARAGGVPDRGRRERTKWLPLPTNVTL
jgi:hypothetical protein